MQSDQGLTQEQMEAMLEKTQKVFDGAIDLLNDYWREVTIDGYHVKPIAVKCREVPTPYHDLELIESRIKAGIKDHQNPANVHLREFREELIFFAKHGIHRSYGIEFYRCDNTTCAHCTSQVPRAKKLLATVRQFGNHLPSPVLHEGMPGKHFQTLLQVLGPLRASDTRPPVGIDVGLPSLPADGSAACSRGCKILSLSKASQRRHGILFRFQDREKEKRDKRKKRQRKEHSRESHGPPEKVWKCGYGDCSFTTSTQYRLRQHKEAEQHKRQRGRPVK